MLDASFEGLTAAEACRRPTKYVLNRLPEARSRSPFLHFLSQFNNVLIYVLLGAAGVTASLQHWVDTGVILAVVLANAVIGFQQECKAEAAMAAIRSMLEVGLAPDSGRGVRAAIRALRAKRRHSATCAEATIKPVPIVLPGIPVPPIQVDTLISSCLSKLGQVT